MSERFILTSREDFFGVRDLQTTFISWRRPPLYSHSRPALEQALASLEDLLDADARGGDNTGYYHWWGEDAWTPNASNTNLARERAARIALQQEEARQRRSTNLTREQQEVIYAELVDQPGTSHHGGYTVRQGEPYPTVSSIYEISTQDIQAWARTAIDTTFTTEQMNRIRNAYLVPRSTIGRTN